MRLEASVTSDRAGKRSSTRDNRRGAFRTTALQASLEGKVKPGRGKTAAVSVKNIRPVIAVAQTSAAPVAVHANGRLAGLALKVGGGFVFFSAGHRTDDCDGKTFRSLDALREASHRRKSDI